VVIATISERPLGTLSWTPRLVGDGANPVNQWQELSHVVAVPAGQADRKQYPAKAGDQVVL
jgi:hypothetical protein